jgi:hypothetical protein
MPTQTPADAGAGGIAGELETPSIHRPAVQSKFGVTLGRGKHVPQGFWHALPVWSPVSLAEILGRHQGKEAWFSLSRFDAGKTRQGKAVLDNYRNGGTFSYAIGCGADVDTEEHRDLTDTERTALFNAANECRLPGDVFYLTPAGGRLLRIFDEPVYDPAEFERQATEFEAEVADALDALGLSHLEPDSRCTRDRARFFYAPNCIAKGRHRKAEVFVLAGAKSLDTEVVTGSAAPKRGRKPRQRVVGVRGIRGVKKGAAALELDADERALVDAAIASTLPATFGSRNVCVLMLLRRLKPIPGVANATGAQLRPIVFEWWNRSKANHRDADFTETWLSAMSAWPSTTGGAEFLFTALTKADDRLDPFAQLVTDTLALSDISSFRRFVGLLCELDRASGGKVWFLSNDKAGDLVGVEGKTAHRWFKILVANGVLAVMEPPKKHQRKATRYWLNRDWAHDGRLLPGLQ